MKAILSSTIALALCALLIGGCSKKESSASADQKAGTNQTSAATEATPETPSGPVDLKLKWPVNTRYVQSMTMEQKTETFLPQMPQPMKNDTTMKQEYGLNVLAERADGGHDIEMEFLSMQVTVSSGDKQVVNFDTHGESADDEGNKLMEGFRKLVGAKLKMILDAKGEVTKVEGMDAFRNKVLSSMPAASRALMGAMFSDGQFKQMLNYGQGLPPKPVTQGESWPMKLDVDLGPVGKAIIDATTTFKGWEKRNQRQCALLSFAGKMQIQSGKNGGAMGMSMSTEDGKISGRTWYDPEESMFVESKIDQSMKLIISMPTPAGRPPAVRGRTNVPAQPAGMQTITNVMVQKINVKLHKEGEAAK